MQGITLNHPNFGSKWKQIDFDSFGTDVYKSKLIEKNMELVTWKDIKNTGLWHYCKKPYKVTITFIINIFDR